MARPLTPADREFVDRTLKLNVINDDIGTRIVATIDILDGDYLTSLKVSARELCELRPAQPLSANTMAAVWALFQKRQGRIAMAHKEINAGKQSYTAYRRSYFLPVSFMRAIQADAGSNDILHDFFPQGVDFSSTYRLYCLDKLTPDGDDYCLVVLDFSMKSILYLDPTKEFDVYRSNPTAKAVEASNGLNAFLDHRMEADSKVDQWNISSAKFPTIKYPFQQNDFDSGIFAFIYVYYSVLECPIIIHPDDINRFRKQLAYWILKEYLPI